MINVTAYAAPAHPMHPVSFLVPLLLPHFYILHTRPLATRLLPVWRTLRPALLLIPWLTDLLIRRAYIQWIPAIPRPTRRTLRLRVRLSRLKGGVFLAGSAVIGAGFAVLVGFRVDGFTVHER